jgi:hypothetical protein
MYRCKLLHRFGHAKHHRLRLMLMGAAALDCLLLMLPQAMASCSRLTWLELDDNSGRVGNCPNALLPPQDPCILLITANINPRHQPVVPMLDMPCTWLPLQPLLSHATAEDACACTTFCTQGLGFCGQGIGVSHLRALTALPRLVMLDLYHLPWAEDAVQLGLGWLVARLPCLRALSANPEVLVRPLPSPACGTLHRPTKFNGLPQHRFCSCEHQQRKSSVAAHESNVCSRMPCKPGSCCNAAQWQTLVNWR